MSQSLRLTRRCGISIPLLAFTMHASGATFCAHTAAEIQADLTAAQADGENDIVKIVNGNYVLASGLTFVSTEAKYLEIAGGFNNASCTGSADLAGSGTSLDGNHLVRPLYVANPNGSVRVSGLTFVAGRPASGNSGGGLLIAGSDYAYVEFNRFYDDRTTGSFAQGGAALVVAASGGEIDNNLAVGNRGTLVGGMVLSGGGFDVYNNTIVSNTTDTLTTPGGMFITGTDKSNLFNNIVWNNAAAGGSDFGTNAANDRYTNDIGSVTPGSIAPGVLTGELSVDPGFASCGFVCLDFPLAPSSPLVNTGTDSYTPGGPPILNETDLVGQPRYIGRHIDIGAYESDRLFANGFEGP